MKYLIIILLSLTLQAQEESASGTATYVAPDNLEARIAALSNTQILVQRCAVMYIAEITEEELTCMEDKNQAVIDFLALRAARHEIKARLRAIGARMKNKHKTFSGLSREMRKCGYTGNHAVRVWRWWKNGNVNKIDCLEAKHLIILEQKELERIKKIAREAAKDSMKLLDCSKESAKMRVYCNAIQALIN